MIYDCLSSLTYDVRNEVMEGRTYSRVPSGGVPEDGASASKHFHSGPHHQG